VKFGIGMNAGEVVAAHVGGGKRRQYDIVGDTVNLGSRLCGQAGKGEIVIPESMIERLSDPPPMEPMGAVALKGLEVPVHLFKIVVEPESGVDSDTTEVAAQRS
jgi:adenylate cyclase